MSLKFIAKQKQILRLTTPNLHPKEQRPLFGDPGTEKRLGPHSHPSDEDLSPGTPGFAQDDTSFYIMDIRDRVLE